MLDGIQFTAIDALKRCGTKIENEWIEPTLEDLPSTLHEMRAIAFGDPECQVVLDRMFIRMLFNYDLGISMVNVGRGYDPYNHVGDNIVAECIGVQ